MNKIKKAFGQEDTEQGIVAEVCLSGNIS